MEGAGLVVVVVLEPILQQLRLEETGRKIVSPMVEAAASTVAAKSELTSDGAAGRRDDDAHRTSAACAVAETIMREYHNTFDSC